MAVFSLQLNPLEEGAITRESAIVLSFISGLIVAVGMGFLVLNPPSFLGPTWTFIYVPVLGISLIGLIDGAIVGRQARRVWRGIIGGIIGAILGAIVGAGVALLLGVGVAQIGALLAAWSGSQRPLPEFLAPLAGIAGASVGAILCAVRAIRMTGGLSNNVSSCESLIKQCTSCGTEYKDEHSCPECGHTSWIRASDKNPT